MKTRNFKFSLLLVIAVVFTTFSTSVFGQVPEKMSYQAVVRNASNELIVNKQIGVFLAIQKTTGGSLPMTYYQEKHVASTNANGLLTLELGGGTPSYPYHALSFSQIPWGEGSFYVKIMIDPAGGTNYTINTESQLLSVPYAMYAKNAGNTTSESSIPNGTKNGDMLYWNGKNWIIIAPSSDGKVLTLKGGVPTWIDNETAIALPTVNTLIPSIITDYSAICEGYVGSDGGGPVVERGICYGASPNLSIVNSKIVCGNGLGSYNAIITKLVMGSTYYIRAYATNSVGTVYGDEVAFTTKNTVTDIDGNTYATVTIGTQTWMVDNLRTTRYCNGDTIANITENGEWVSATTGAQCNYQNNLKNDTKYGKLYNWYAVVDSRKLAPAGWHVPSNDEWTELLDYVANHLGTSPNVAKALAAKTDWFATSTNYTDAVGDDLTKNNSSGFSGLPSGHRTDTGNFFYLEKGGNWWSTSTTSNDYINAYYMGLLFDTNFHLLSSQPKRKGYSVRCIRDN
jgi:uncharacterized protein (TIGR02145 family)